VLGDEHAAEDAFQATFLVLVKKAATLRDCTLLTNWLYGVALRVANKEKVRGARRRVVERQAAERTARPSGDLDQGELRSVIDEEIRRLPERYRLPLVLCHLEGLRHDEVAQRLGCPVGTVESRLSRAREQLRSRLTRRGLAPTASVLGAVLKPPDISPVLPHLAEATVKAVIDLSSQQAAVLTMSAWGLAQWLGRLISAPLASTAAVGSALVIGIGIVALSRGVFRAEDKPPQPSPPPVSVMTPAGGALRATIAPSDPPPPRGSTSRDNPPPATIARNDPLPPQSTIARSDPAPPQSTIARSEPSPPRRSSFAVAQPMSGITIDGRLDDWPKEFARYPIRNQLLNIPSIYDPKPRERNPDPDAYFMVGYNRQDGLIYLAAVVRDADLVVHAASPSGIGDNVFQTDAVEVYVDGTFSERRVPFEPAVFDAATMPVLQYVGVPGQVPAYGDRWGANPSLVYSRTKERRTQMRYRRDGDITTYEWAIQAYDQFPDRPTRLAPGKRIGLDVVVVDKDAGDGRPAWMYWGPPYREFKGCDAGNLGELILADDP
jgi:RNA polymerase sigma factor (sigma-70 family)